MSDAATTLPQLTAILEEIAALVRAGVPLDQGLLHVGRDFPGHAGGLMRGLAEDVRRGESLPAALAKRATAFPPVFRAVVEAGLRSGELAPAVEGLLGLARQLSETRRTLRLALAYPLFLIFMAYGLLLVFAAVVAGPLADALREGVAPGDAEHLPLMAAFLQRLPDSWPYWGAIFPVVLVTLLACWSWRINRGGLLQPSVAIHVLSWVPWFKRLLRSATDALTLDVLATLLERNVPLPETVILAAQTSGSPKAAAAGEMLADHLRRGLPPEREGVKDAGLPPRVAWLLRGAFSPEARLATLRRMADDCRRRADEQAVAARLWLPVTMTIAIGGAVTVLYVLTLFLPWVQLISRWVPS